MFQVDHNKARANELPPEGEYECIIDFARLTATKMGTPYINIPLIVRQDVDNPQKGGKIFHSMWMKKEPTQADEACDGFSAKQIQSLSKAAGLPNGKAYASIEEWCDDLAGRPVRATVEHDEYKGKVNARVKWFNASEHPVVVAENTDTSFQPMDDDGDVPF